MKKLNLMMIVLSLSITSFAEEVEIKEACTPLDKKKIESIFGSSKVSYIEFLNLINSRRINVNKGESVKSYVLQDEYSYISEEEGIKLYKMANGLSSDKFSKSKEITLPFCANNSRELAAIGNVEAVLEKGKTQNDKAVNFSLSTQYGNLEVEGKDSKFSMNFLKLSANASYKLNSEYFLTSTLSAVQFRDVEHSDTDEKVGATTLYPELGLSLFKKAGKFNYGVGYDFLQYFIRDTSVAGVSLEPSQTHRISPKISYSLTDNLSLIGSVGMLRSFGGNSISGIDGVIGANYKFGKSKKISLTPILYRGKVERSNSESSEDSSVLAITLGYRF